MLKTMSSMLKNKFCTVRWWVLLLDYGRSEAMGGKILQF